MLQRILCLLLAKAQGAIPFCRWLGITVMLYSHQKKPEIKSMQLKATPEGQKDECPDTCSTAHTVCTVPSVVARLSSLVYKGTSSGPDRVTRGETDSGRRDPRLSTGGQHNAVPAAPSHCRRALGDTQPRPNSRANAISRRGAASSCSAGTQTCLTAAASTLRHRAPGSAAHAGPRPAPARSSAPTWPGSRQRRSGRRGAWAGERSVGASPRQKERSGTTESDPSSTTPAELDSPHRRRSPNRAGSKPSCYREPVESGRKAASPLPQSPAARGTHPPPARAPGMLAAAVAPPSGTDRLQSHLRISEGKRQPGACAVRRRLLAPCGRPVRAVEGLP